ncbi:MAG: hypothetical protein ACXWF8_04830 [Methylobacter sp.]
METLKLTQQTKSAKNRRSRKLKTEEELIDLFPLPQYFQIHFQHVHENAHDLQGELTQLKNYIAKVDEKLERLLTLLNRPITEHAA